MLVGSIVGNQYLANAGDCGGFFGSAATIGACDQDIDICAHSLGGCYRVESGNLEAAVVVFCYNKSTHQITFASFFSLSTS